MEPILSRFKNILINLKPTSENDYLTSSKLVYVCSLLLMNDMSF